MTSPSKDLCTWDAGAAAEVKDRGGGGTGEERQKFVQIEEAGIGGGRDVSLMGEGPGVVTLCDSVVGGGVQAVGVHSGAVSSYVSRFSASMV